MTGALGAAPPALHATVPEQNDLGPTGTGAVMADVGGDQGALVLYAPESLCGVEIEISPVAGGARTHVAIRERRAGEGRLFAAFYPALAAGEYQVWSSATVAAGTVVIAGGEVAEASIAPTAGSHSIVISRAPESSLARRPVADTDRSQH